MDESGMQKYKKNFLLKTSSVISASLSLSLSLSLSQIHTNSFLRTSTLILDISLFLSHTQTHQHTRTSSPKHTNKYTHSVCLSLLHQLVLVLPFSFFLIDNWSPIAHIHMTFSMKLRKFAETENIKNQILISFQEVKQFFGLFKIDCNC